MLVFAVLWAVQSQFDSLEGKNIFVLKPLVGWVLETLPLMLKQPLCVSDHKTPSVLVVNELKGTFIPVYAVMSHLIYSTLILY